jgi:hypothetical protein
MWQVIAGTPGKSRWAFVLETTRTQWPHGRMSILGTGSADREPTTGDTAGTLLLHVTATSMDVSPPWFPSERVNVLPAFAQLNDVIGDALIPDNIDCEPWAMRSLEGQLSQAPDGRDALWASILALWRLGSLEKIMSEMDEDAKQLWRLHVLAWLVRVDGRSR